MILRVVAAIVLALTRQALAETQEPGSVYDIEHESVGDAIGHEYYDNCWLTPGAAEFIANELSLGWAVVPAIRGGEFSISGVRSHSREFALLQFGKVGCGGRHGRGDYCLVDARGEVLWRNTYPAHALPRVSNLGVSAIVHKRPEANEAAVQFIDSGGRELRSVTFENWMLGGFLSRDVAHAFSFGQDGLFYIAMRQVEADSIHAIDPLAGTVCSSPLMPMVPVDMRPSVQCGGVVIKGWDKAGGVYSDLLSVHVRDDCTADEPVIVKPGRQ